MADDKAPSEEQTTKRITINIDGPTLRKCEALKALNEKSRDEVVSEGITDLYKKTLHSLAKEEGIVKDPPQIEIRREHFSESKISEFDDICVALGIRDADINSIVIEVNKFTSRKD